jgi:two-component system sensor histidine kinase TctE
LFDLVNAQAESQARFVTDAAHQLRTPLAGLQAQVEAWAQTVNCSGQADWRDRSASAIERGLSSDPAVPASITLSAEQINKLRGAARRTSQLANQLLALSRADARNPQTQPKQRIDLKQLCEVMLENYLDLAASKGIDIGLDALPVHVTGYEWLLREFLSNLVDNAIKYTPTGGRVTLRCGHRNVSAQGPLQPFLEVEDDGPGVPLHERQRVLERFYRVTGTSTEGNGLGLAIAKEIAEVHSGQLVLDDGSGAKGLRVSLSFLA